MCLKPPAKVVKNNGTANTVKHKNNGRKAFLG